MLGKLTQSPAGKAGVVVAAVVMIAVGAFVVFNVTSGGGPQVADPAEVKADAQKQIDQINNNHNLPPALKAQQLAHEQGLAAGASKGMGAAPPSGGQ